MFTALLINKNDNEYVTTMETLDESQLPDGDVTVAVSYSTMNYKDALAITGKSPVVRQFPMVPGIDLVGEVIESRDQEFHVGQQVLLNGWGVGEKHWGGLAQKARLSGEWLIPLPSGLLPEQAMMIGTAGYTAMLSVIALEHHGLKAGDGTVLVTGANGGVGSFAIMLLSQLGYNVIASTGRIEEETYLTSLGATEVIERSTLSETGRPLGKEQWVGAIDSVGSHTLANVCASTSYGGVVAACGLAQGMDFPASVAPFILRGVTLVGIDSVMRPKVDRLKAWERLSKEFNLEQLNAISNTISLNEAIDSAEDLLAGKVRGRLLVEL